ncbi:MAG: dihydrolipoyl dehydrogenase [Anaerolineae bacterium]|nr:dihydrolipoyl dehydrogenase [Anaerolineae bacterium]
MNEYDVVIIGAGPGGYVCAVRASQNGLKAAIIDKKWLGGVCLNVGCVPSKALLKNAELAHTLRERAEEFGISFDNLKLDYASAVKRSRGVSQRLTRGVAFLMKKNNVDVFMGEAKVGADKKITVTDSEGKTQQIGAKNIVIATGSTPVMPAAWQADGEKIISYNEAILQEKLPKSAVIIGAGAIGAEFATIWNSYGVPVTMVEMLPNVLPLEDEEVSQELAKAFKKRGIEILTGHKVEAVEKSKDGVIVKVSGDGGQKSIEAEQALVAIGFRPNSAGLGLEEAGVKLDGKGFIQVDEKLATNVPGIWAIGDVTGKLLLAHLASAQGILCADALAGRQVNPINYQNVPHATYCQPQVASFGLSEAQAKASGKEIKVGRFPFQANGKALGLGETTGFIKIISDAKYGEILGAHIIGPEASELLPELTLAQQMELTAEEIARNIHAHPTLSEVVMEAAEAVEGQSINI